MKTFQYKKLIPKYKIKLNPRFGWTEAQIEEIQTILLTITNNKVREKVPWYIQLTGISLRQQPVRAK
jgi:ABC-type molybdate transport system ATPase subunit